MQDLNGFDYWFVPHILGSHDAELADGESVCLSCQMPQISHYVHETSGMTAPDLSAIVPDESIFTISIILFIIRSLSSDLFML